MLHRSILTAAAAALALHHPVAAVAVPQPTAAVDEHYQLLAARDLDKWVQVGSDGSPVTVIPQVTTSGSSAFTISPAPEATFTTTKDGKTVTSTGQNPTPTAKSESGAGSFVLCDNNVGEFSPFCTPRDGSVLIIGRTYYVTWDPEYFSGGNGPVDVEGHSSNRMVFEKSEIDPSLGFYAWTPSEGLLEGENSGSKSITLMLEYHSKDESNSITRQKITGPVVSVRRSEPDDDDSNDKDDDDESSGGSNTKSLAIAIPIVVVLVLGAILGFFLWKKKKNGGGGIRISGFGFGKKNAGYGQRQSWAQRTGQGESNVPGLDNKGPAFQLDDSPRSPTGGRNVFRDELRRQEQSGP